MIGDILVVGASGGIGSEVVKAQLERGRTVLGVDVLPPSIGHPDYEHHLSDAGSEGVLFDLISNRPSIRHVINVAGGAVPEEVNDSGNPPIASLGDATWHNNVDTVVEAINACDRLWSDDTIDRSLTFCSSINSSAAFGFPNYTMAKASIESLTVTLAPRLGARGIRVNCVRLGTVVTESSLRLHDSDEEHYRLLLELSALRRFVTEREAADALGAFIELRGCTAAILTVDCGQSTAGLRR